MWANGGQALTHIKQKGQFTAFETTLGEIMQNEIDGTPTNDIVVCDGKEDNACLTYGFRIDMHGRTAVQTAYACTSALDYECTEWNHEEEVFGSEVSFFCNLCYGDACNDPGANSATSIRAPPISVIITTAAVTVGAIMISASLQ
jgi:hypothetical protein